MRRSDLFDPEGRGCLTCSLAVGYRHAELFRKCGCLVWWSFLSGMDFDQLIKNLEFIPRYISENHCFFYFPEL